MPDYDRASILDETHYQYDMKGNPHDSSSKKSWWTIGLLIGFVMNFIAFVIMYYYYKGHYLKKISV